MTVEITADHIREARDYIACHGEPEVIQQLARLIAFVDRRARREERIATAAWLFDRAEQYKPRSGIRAAFDELFEPIAGGAPIDAMRHGELDDLVDRAECWERHYRGGR